MAQYSGYEPLPGLHINGELTQGENIADIGGVKLAFTALQKAIAKKGPQPKIDGFTPEQRFFLGFAQIWRNNQRDEDLKLRLNTDPHSPGRFRTSDRSRIWMNSKRPSGFVPAASASLMSPLRL